MTRPGFVFDFVKTCYHFVCGGRMVLAMNSNTPYGRGVSLTKATKRTNHLSESVML